MTVRQQDAVEPPKARAAAQQLALRTLAAIDEDALACCLHQESRMVALRRWNARRSPEKCQGEHGRQCPGFTAPNATRAAARTGPSIPYRARQAVRIPRSGARARPAA